MDQTRAQALEELGGKLERMNAALANIGEAIAWTDSNGSLQWCNSTFCKLTGVRQEEVLNRPLVEALPLQSNGRNLTDEDHPIHKALASSKNPSGIYDYHLDGKMLALEITTAKFHFEKSGGTCAVLTARDITARQNAEMKLQQTHQSRIDMMASISREIRNSMVGIIGMTDLVLTAPVSDEQRDYLGMVIEAAQSLLDEYGPMLDLSEIEAGHLTLKNLPLELETLGLEIGARYRPAARDRGIKLEVSGWDAGPAVVVADRKRLAQILSELVGNAIAATESGSVHLEVTCEEQSETLARLCFEVRDTGAGIPETTIDHLFDPPPRGDGNRSEPCTQQIYGLMLTKRLVDLMGGKLLVTSQAGQGTSFRIIVSFPLDQGSIQGSRRIGVHDSEQGVRKELRKNGDPSSGAAAAGKHILLVESDGVNKKLLASRLARLGCDVLEAGSVAQALEACKPEELDLVLVSCSPPIQTAHEVTRALRATEAGGKRHLVIVGLTVSPLADEQAGCLRAGMDAYVETPTCSEDMACLLSEFAHDDPVEPGTTESERATRDLDPGAIPTEAEELSSAVSRATVATLRELGDSSEFLSTLVNQYVGDTKQRLVTLRTAASKADVEVIEHTANSLKSSSASMGADRMAQICSKLEALGRTRDIEGVQDLLNQASGEFETIREELNQILSGPGS